MTDFEIIDAIEQVRSKNNINWMNILRLAFKYSPSEAREIITKINESLITNDIARPSSSIKFK